MENLDQPTEEPKKEVKRSRARWWIVGVCLTSTFLLFTLLTQNIFVGFIAMVIGGIVPLLAALMTRLFAPARWHIAFLISWILWTIIEVVLFYILLAHFANILWEIFKKIVGK